MTYKLLAVFLLTPVLIFNSGCSVFMAAKQPDKKNGFVQVGNFKKHASG